MAVRSVPASTNPPPGTHVHQLLNAMVLKYVALPASLSLCLGIVLTALVYAVLMMFRFNARTGKLTLRSPRTYMVGNEATDLETFKIAMRATWQR
jgi:hypothetical protein